MLTTVEYGRLYAPPEDPTKPNDRKVVHLETSLDMIRANAEGGSMKELMGMQMYVSQQCPPGVQNAVWLEITGTRATV